MSEKALKKKKILKRIIIGVVIFIAVNYIAYLAIASPIMMKVLRDGGVNKDTSEETMSNWVQEDMGYDLDGFLAKYEIEEFTLHSDDCKDPHDIPAYYIYAEGVDTKEAPTVVMAHGMSASHICTYPYAELFLKKGYNVITYDQHSFGESEEVYVSYGYFESRDFLACVQYAVDAAGENTIGCWGQSMGGATIENAMDEELVKENVDFIVLDCPMGSIAESTHADPVHNFTTSMLNKVVMGWSFNDQSPYKQAEGNAIPVMMVVAGKDASVSEASYNKTGEILGESGVSYVYEQTNAEHAKVYYRDPVGYANALDDFLLKVAGIEE